jgi:hypothetical protein
LPAHEFHRAAFDRLAVDFLVDSSKDEAWIVDTHRWAKLGGFTVRNVLIWKNPTELAFSWWKRGKSIDFWRREFITYHSHLRTANVEFIAVNHRELLTSPAVVLQRICEYCGMEYFVDKEQFWQKRDYHYLFGSAGTLKQVRENRVAEVNQPHYPKEFVKAISSDESRDSEVKATVDWLMQHDHKVKMNGFQKASVEPGVAYPAWYFLNRAKKLVRRAFPRREEW